MGGGISWSGKGLQLHRTTRPNTRAPPTMDKPGALGEVCHRQHAVPELFLNLTLGTLGYMSYSVQSRIQEPSPLTCPDSRPAALYCTPLLTASLHEWTMTPKRGPSSPERERGQAQTASGPRSPSPSRAQNRFLHVSPYTPDSCGAVPRWMLACYVYTRSFQCIPRLVETPRVLLVITPTASARCS